jgi:hypothetical protein
MLVIVTRPPENERFSKPVDLSRDPRYMSESDRRDANDLRRAVRSLVAAALEHAPERELATAIHALCTLARKQRVSIERLLVVLREAWEVANPPPGPQGREEIRARLASHCIHVFYRIPSPRCFLCASGPVP